MRLSVAECLARMSQSLQPITDTPRLEAEMLLAHAMGLSRASLLTRLQDPVDSNLAASGLQRRLNYEPLAYIFGEWEFWGLPFQVMPPLLTPRPETEHLVEAVLHWMGEYSVKPMSRTLIVDLCCGTGCVGIALSKSASSIVVLAMDVCDKALQITKRNAERHGVVLWPVQSDLLHALTDFGPKVDVIASNPPYVCDSEWSQLSPVITRHEDPKALLAGKNGLDIIRQIIPASTLHLRSGGLLALEVGENQAEETAVMFQQEGFARIEARKDLSGHLRVISGVYQAE